MIERTSYEIPKPSGHTADAYRCFVIAERYYADFSGEKRHRLPGQLFQSNHQELVVDGAKQSVGWLVFKPHYADSNNIRSAMLMVHITWVLKPGLCGIHTLMTKIIVPESRVTLENVKFDDMPVASLALDTSFSDQMLLLDVTDLVKSKSFNGGMHLDVDEWFVRTLRLKRRFPSAGDPYNPRFAFSESA